MAKVEERLKAEELRRQGWSVAAIAREVKVSKSSASTWCQGVRLTKVQKDDLVRKWKEGGQRGRILGSATNHRRKLERIQYHVDEGKKEVSALTSRELLLIGVAIYWGEGNKKSRLSFINSDATMVQFMYQWFQVALGVDKDHFMPRIFINDLHRGREKEILGYWAKLLKLPEEQFRKTIFIRRPNTKRYANHDNYFGLLSMGVRNSQEIKYKILGLIEGIKCSKF